MGIRGSAKRSSTRRCVALTRSSVSTSIPGFSYRATDAGGIVEDELCPVVVARLSLPEELVELNPDPDEVEEVTWVGWQDMYGLARSMPALLSPWAVEQMLEFGPELPVVR